jgi:hypothetical protein
LFLQQYLDESGAFIKEVNVIHDDSDAALASQAAAGVRFFVVTFLTSAY